MALTELCKIIRIEGGIRNETEDPVVLETPLDIVVDGVPLSTVYCSPDSPDALVYGYLVNSGIIRALDEVENLEFTDDRRKALVTLSERHPEAGGGNSNPRFTLSLAHLETVAETFMPGTANFRNTGALHSAGLCRDDKILIYKEDVSRHCAFDKMVGEALIQGICLRECYAMTSGRIPRDMFEKVICAGLPAVFSRSAPTRETVVLARNTGILLGGFVRKGRMNIYSGAERIL